MLARFADGELPVNEARVIEAHLASCPSCRAAYDVLSAMLKGLATPSISTTARSPSGSGTGDAGDPFVRRVMASLDAPAAPAPWWQSFLRGPRWAPLALAAAAIVLVAVPVMRNGERENGRSNGLQARGGGTKATLAARASAEVVIVRGKTLLGLEQDPAQPALPPTLHPSDGLAVRATNLVADEAVFLLAFALDAAGTVHWLYPAYLDARDDPAAVRLEPGMRQTLLGEVTTPTDVAAGPLRLVTVLSSSKARHVKEVERLLAGTHSATAVAGLFAGDVVSERVIRQGPTR